MSAKRRLGLESGFSALSEIEMTEGRRDWVRQTFCMMRFVNPEEKDTFLQLDERWMRPLKSGGTHMVTSAFELE